MSVYTWPSTAGWSPNAFEMRVIPNAFTFTSTYSKTTQTIDFLGERWAVKVDLANDNNLILGAAREAFFDRLRGPVNLIAMWNLRRPLPQGTLRDGGGTAQWKNNAAVNANWVNNVAAAATWSTSGPVIYAANQLDGTIVIATTPGKTLLAGDHFGAGLQLFRVMADATADSAGKLTVEVLPRVRTTLPISTPVVCTKPTANFMLKADGVPITWRPGMFDGASLDLIEAY